MFAQIAQVDKIRGSRGLIFIYRLCW